MTFIITVIIKIYIIITTIIHVINFRSIAIFIKFSFSS